MRDLAGLDWKDKDVTTVGGYIIHQIRHLPCTGEQLCTDGYIVTIEQADSRRVQQMRFQRRLKTGAQGPGIKGIARINSGQGCG